MKLILWHGLAILMATQLIFDMVIYNAVTRNETPALSLQKSTLEYPGYYCGQHNCSLPPLGIPLNGH